MSLHMFPATRAEARVGDRRVIVEEKDGVAYVLVDDEPIEMRCRLRETGNSAYGETGEGDAPPYALAHTFPLESAPDSVPEIRTYAMGSILVQWELPKGILRVELSPDMTSADVDLWQHYNA